MDRATLEPVPWCSVRVSQVGRRSVEARSDAEGFVRTATAFVPGTIELSLIGDVAPREPFPTACEVAASDRRLTTTDGTVLVDIGPTYRIGFDGPLEVASDGLTVRLIADARATEGVASTLRSDGGGTWTRFRRLELTDTPEALRWLEVRAPDGSWRARAPVASVIGRSADIVVLHIDRTGSVGGRVADEHGRPLETELFLSHLDSNGRTASTEHMESDADGMYEFGVLPAGSYALETGSGKFKPWRHTFELSPGGHVPLPVSLERELGDCRVSGTLRSTTGTYALPLTLSLESTRSDATRTLAIQHWTKTEGHYTADFEFEAVDPGPYRLRIHAGGGFDWAPAGLLVEAPAANLEIVCHDDVPTHALAFVVYDAVTSEPIPMFGAEVRVLARDGTERLSRQSSCTSRAPILSVRADSSPLEWSVRVPGYEPAYGSADAFEQADSGSPVWCADVRLRPGWGLEFCVLVGAGAAARPVEGARILLDGCTAGTTDARGLARVTALAAPARIDVRAENRRILAGDVDPGTGVLGPVITRATIWLSQ
ncbi:MAG: hypothetical protein IT459_17045 [Planctomycetes bacterium]|nr:hypothetical protein [Planctomycetota bacterium]